MYQYQHLNQNILTSSTTKGRLVTNGLVASRSQEWLLKIWPVWSQATQTQTCQNHSIEKHKNLTITLSKTYRCILIYLRFVCLWCIYDVFDDVVWWCFHVIDVSLKFQALSPLMLWIVLWVFVQRRGRCWLGSSKRRPVRAGSYHNAAKHRILFLSFFIYFSQFQFAHTKFKPFWIILKGMAVFISQHFDRLTRGERSALGGVEDEFADAHVGRVPSRFVATVPLTRAFNCVWPFYFSLFFSSIWVIKVALANLILLQKSMNF